MIEICKSLIEQKKRFESLRKSVEEQLNELREGKIRIVNNEGRELYYLKTEENRKQYPQNIRYLCFCVYQKMIKVMNIGKQRYYT